MQCRRSHEELDLLLFDISNKRVPLSLSSKRWSPRGLEPTNEIFPFFPLKKMVSQRP